MTTRARKSAPITPAQPRQKNGSRNGFTDSTPTFWPLNSMPSPSTPSSFNVAISENRALPVEPAPWLCSSPWVASPSLAAYVLSRIVMLAPVSSRKSAGSAPLMRARTHTCRALYRNVACARPGVLSQVMRFASGVGGRKRAGSIG